MKAWDAVKGDLGTLTVRRNVDVESEAGVRTSESRAATRKKIAQRFSAG
jgi:hypothetical protein